MASVIISSVCVHKSIPSSSSYMYIPHQAVLNSVRFIIPASDALVSGAKFNH